MGKLHLKRLTMPGTWALKRKGVVFAIRPNPGTHPLEHCMPLGLILREVLGYAKTLREVKKILRNRNVMVDGKRRTDVHFPVGLFDTLQFIDIKQNFRLVFNNQGRLELKPISEAEARLKLCKILNKSRFKNKFLWRLYDGRNLLTDDDAYNTHDTLLLELPEQNVKNHLPLEKDTLIYLVGGSHKGQLGVVEKIEGRKILYKNTEGHVVETIKKYAFAVGKDKPLVTL